MVNLDFAPPVPSVSLYLHNNPSPPVGDTASQATLPLDSTAPTATTLYKYGVPNNNPGLLIKGTTEGLSENDETQFQIWRTGPLAAPLGINGDVLIDLWGAIRQFHLGQSGAVTMYLRDYDGGAYTEIANGSVFAEDWQAGSDGFVNRTILIADVNYTVPASHELETRLVTDTIKASKDMWIAYDTVDYPSVINLP